MITEKEHAHTEGREMMQGIKVFVIESQMLVREGIGMILQRSGLQITGLAGSSHQALEKIQHIKPDVVLLDVSLKDMHPIDLMQVILRTHPKAKVIFIAEGVTRQLLTDGISAGICGYFHKDGGQDTLVKAITDVFAGGTYFPSDASKLIFEEFYRAEAGSADTRSNPVSMLTIREKQILAAMSEGLKNREIAVSLMISVKTVETHKKNTIKKLGAKTAAEAVLFAIRSGVIAVN